MNRVNWGDVLTGHDDFEPVVFLSEQILGWHEYLVKLHESRAYRTLITGLT